MKRYIGFFLFLISFSLVCQGQKDSTTTKRDLYQTNWTKESLIGGTSVAVLAGYGIISQRRSIITEEEVLSLKKETIFSLDQSAVENYSTSAVTLSDYGRNLAFVVPFSMYLSKDVRNEATDFLLMYGETMAVNAAITVIAKTLAKRERPYLYNPDIPTETKINNTAQESFYSGHASHTAAMSFFTAQVFSDVYPDSKFKPLVWTAAGMIPAFTGYMRYKAGRHFPSDVVIGCVIGTAVGILIPRMHRKFKENNIQLTASPNGSGIGLTIGLN